MATIYTLEMAEARALERSKRDGAAYTVWQHSSGDPDFIVRSFVLSDPRDFHDFHRVVTYWHDGSISRYAHKEG